METSIGIYFDFFSTMSDLQFYAKHDHSVVDKRSRQATFENGLSLGIASR